jgi:hypothetical protein
MSMKSWKKEFYPIEAKDCPEKDALQHSLQKWKGLRKENLDKHGVNLDFYAVFVKGKKGSVTIDSDSCALCVHHRKLSSIGLIDCSKCPLFLERKLRCDQIEIGKNNSPYSALGGDFVEIDGEYVEMSNPEPMIELIEAAIKTSELSQS